MDTQATYLYQRNSNDGRQRPGNSRNGDDDNGTNPRKKGISSLRIFLFTIALVAVLADRLPHSQRSGINYEWSTGQRASLQLILPASHEWKRQGCTFQGQDITGDFKNPLSLTDANGNPVLANQYHLTQIPNGDPNLIPLLNKYHVAYQAKPVPATNGFLIILLDLLPLILVFGVIFFISRRATKSQQNIFSFGKTRAKVVLGDKPDTTFADVAGVNEAKADHVEVVEISEDSK